MINKKATAKNQLKKPQKSEKQIIKKLRKTRKKLWEEEMAAPVQFKMKTKGKKMESKKIKAQRLLKELQESIAGRPSPFAGMSEDEVIENLRKTREKLWEEKLASGY